MPPSHPDEAHRRHFARPAFRADDLLRDQDDDADHLLPRAKTRICSADRHGRPSNAPSAASTSLLRSALRALAGVRIRRRTLAMAWSAKPRALGVRQLAIHLQPYSPPSNTHPAAQVDLDIHALPMPARSTSAAPERLAGSHEQPISFQHLLSAKAPPAGHCAMWSELRLVETGTPWQRQFATSPQPASGRHRSSALKKRGLPTVTS